MKSISRTMLLVLALVFATWVIPAQAATQNALLTGSVFDSTGVPAPPSG